MPYLFVDRLVNCQLKAVFNEFNDTWRTSRHVWITLLLCLLLVSGTSIYSENIPVSIVLLQQCHCRNRHRGKLQNEAPPSALFESSRNFFTIHRRHRRKKRWTRILKLEFCDFWEFFLKFSKRHHAIWIVMVAAKLDQRRVLVTKFHQNRSTLKGRSAVRDTQTHRQANLAENNGPSGLQSGQQTTLLGL